MELFVNLAEVGVGDVGVNLGGGDVGVAEKSLDGAEVCAVHEEVCGERVAESVRSDVFGDAGGASVFVDNALDGTSGEAAEVAGSVDGVEVVRVVEEESREGIVAGGEVVARGVGGGDGDKNRAVFLAFAADEELTAVEVDRIAIKRDKLGDAQTAGEK